MTDDNRKPFDLNSRAAEIAADLPVLVIDKSKPTVGDMLRGGVTMTTADLRAAVTKALVGLGEEAWREAMHQAAVSVDVARQEGFKQGEEAAQEGFKALLKRQKNDAVQKVIRARRKAKRLRREAKIAELSAIRSRGFANACEHVLSQLDPGGEDDQ